VDGAVEKAATKRVIHEIAGQHIDHRNPGDFNQAMMEFGAVVCTPVRPGCDTCIFRETCFARLNQCVERLPEKEIKTGVRRRYLHYLVLTASIAGEEGIYLNRRTANDIWKNLYDFPLVERPDDRMLRRLKEKDFSRILAIPPGGFGSVSDPYVHLLSHQKLHARFYRYHMHPPVELPFLFVPWRNFDNYPIPRLIERYTETNRIAGI
jgi:A/G-specific adenine glycosylase